MRDAHRGIGLVDVLAARPGGAIGVNAQIRRIDLDLIDLIELRQDRDRARGGMDAPLRLGGRHALHAMRARLKLQAGEGALAGDAADDLAEAAVLAGALAQHFDVEAFRFGITCIHAVEVAGEDRGLIPAGTRAHLEKDVALIAWIGRQQQAAQLELRRLELAREPRDLLAPERAHAGIAIVLQIARGQQIPLEVVVALQAFGERLQPGIFHRQIAKLPGAAGELIAREQPADLLEAIGQFLQALVDGVLHASAAAGPASRPAYAIPRRPKRRLRLSTGGAAFSGMFALCDKLLNAPAWGTLYSDKVSRMDRISRISSHLCA